MSKKLDPDIAEKVMLNAGLKPLEPYKSSSSKWKCECLTCSRTVFPSYSNVKNGSGCLFCKGGKTDPEEAVKRMHEAGLEPLEPFISGRKKWRARCVRCGSIVNPALHDLRRGSEGCKKCGMDKLSTMLKYSQEEAIEIMQKANFQPLEPYRRSNLPFKSECLICHSVVSPYLSSILEGGGCKVCAGKKFGNATKLNEEVAVQRMLKAGLQPLVPYSRADVGWKSKCLKCGAIIYPHLTSISKGGGCRYCAKAGLQMLKPSYLYLITHTEHNAHKIGIGNQRKRRDRVKKFMNKGWSVFRVWEFATGEEVLKIEREVFNVIRKEKNIPIFLSSEQMPVTGGETETMDADLISLKELERIIERVIDKN